MLAGSATPSCVAQGSNKGIMVGASSTPSARYSRRRTNPRWPGSRTPDPPGKPAALRQASASQPVSRLKFASPPNAAGSIGSPAKLMIPSNGSDPGPKKVPLESINVATTPSSATDLAHFRGTFRHLLNFFHSSKTSGNDTGANFYRLFDYVETPSPFVGAEKCAKLCHKAQYESWLTTGHASGFSKLSDEEKAKTECVGCHITGKMADGTVLENVQCEACHGAGKDYKSPKIMSKSKWKADPDTHKKMAVDAGLIYPTAEHCQKCHKEEGNPNFKPFNFEEAKGKVHAFEE